MEAFPFYLTYMADGSVEINSFNEVGNIRLGKLCLYRLSLPQ